MTSARNNIELHFTDDVSVQLAVAPGETVLDASLKAGIPLLHQCQSGSCGSCMAKLVVGDARMRAGVGSTLLPSEAALGMRLLCLTEPAGDCRFDFSYPSAAGALPQRRVHTFVNAIERLASNVIRLKLELADGDWLEFKAGQFLQLSVPGAGVLRRYSPASTPQDLPTIELLIRLLPNGVMSEWLSERAKHDDIVELAGPFGAFFVREKSRVPHILVAGGTGLAPILSILDTLRKQAGHKPPILLSFGCASADALFGLEELALRQHWLPNLTLRVTVERGASGSIATGNPVDALQAGDAADPATVAYVCGPPAMVAAAHRRLREFGLAATQIFSEQFVAS